MSTPGARPDSKTAAVQPRCALVVRDGPLAGRRFGVESRLEIGRHGTDCTLDDHQVSHRHAAVTVDRDAMVIEDLGSTNGTWVNGVRITGPVALHDGDLVRVGATTLAVELAAPSIAGPRAEPHPQPQGPPTVPACALVARNGPLAGRRFEVESRLEIGRRGTDCTLDDHQVSHRHAAVTVERDGAVIEDLGSTNGTWVNGGRITGPVALHDGDLVRVGATTLAVELAAPSPVGPGPAAGAAASTDAIPESGVRTGLSGLHVMPGRARRSMVVVAVMAVVIIVAVVLVLVLAGGK
jgi:pSer/pThr/pTyr-binding forkhead associated (FHA) protein